MLGPRQPSRARPRAVPATACSNRLRDYLPKEMLPEENFGLGSQAVTVKNWSQEATLPSQVQNGVFSAKRAPKPAGWHLVI